MIMIANLQYGWTLFVDPIQDRFHWSKAAIQIAFTTFIVVETWLVPVEGYLIDRFGPSRITVAGGALVGASWLMYAAAGSLWMFYAGAVVGGIGAGIVYGTTVGQALKWFPDRRGLATGLTAGGFGAGSALTIIPIARMVHAQGYQHAFLVFGLLQASSSSSSACCCVRRGRARRRSRWRQRSCRRPVATRRPHRCCARRCFT